MRTLIGAKCALQPFRLSNSIFHGASLRSLRYSSLSAIHKGLRKSEKVRPQGHVRAADRGVEASRTSRHAQRKADRKTFEKPAFRLRRGKKDVTDTGPAAVSRKARFNDPNDSFGKKSLVYKFKSGDLSREVARLEDQVKARSSTPTSGTNSFGQLPPSDRNKSLRAELTRDAFGERFSGAHKDRADSALRPSTKRHAPPPMGERRPGRFSERRGPTSHRRDQPAENMGAFGRAPHSERGRSFEDRPSYERSAPRTAPRSAWGRSDEDGETPQRLFNMGDEPRPQQNFSPRSRTQDEGFGMRPREVRSGETPHKRPSFVPMSIPYTTAASQFLYGTSVVQSALWSARRKLYHLYIYGGANRQKLQQDASIEHLARRLGVKTTVLGDNGARMMEKMAKGRPHNGYILEASPLPQLPLTGLGEVGEEGGKPGFKLNISHQSAEDAAINGTSDFQPSKSATRQPFVLLLDQVLDPGNIGAILRTASFLGVTAVVMSKDNSAPLTSVALKASAGASESIPIFSTVSAASFLAESKDAGWKVFAAVPPSSTSNPDKQVSLDQVEKDDPLLSDPCILVVGSEGEGLPRAVKAKADHEVSIPNHSGANTIDSLNVSVATALLCNSFVKHELKSSIAPAFEVPDRKDDLNIW